MSSVPNDINFKGTVSDTSSVNEASNPVKEGTQDTTSTKCSLPLEDTAKSIAVAANTAKDAVLNSATVSGVRTDVSTFDKHYGVSDSIQKTAHAIGTTVKEVAKGTNKVVDNTIVPAKDVLISKAKQVKTKVDDTVDSVLATTNSVITTTKAKLAKPFVRFSNVPEKKQEGKEDSWKSANTRVQMPHDRTIKNGGTDVESFGHQSNYSGGGWINCQTPKKQDCQDCANNFLCLLQ